MPWAWRVYAYRGYLLLQAMDRSLLEPHLPPALFYNLLRLGARDPSGACAIARNGDAGRCDQGVVEGPCTEG